MFEIPSMTWTSGQISDLNLIHCEDSAEVSIPSSSGSAVPTSGPVGEYSMPTRRQRRRREGSKGAYAVSIWSVVARLEDEVADAPTAVPATLGKQSVEAAIQATARHSALWSMKTERTRGPLYWWVRKPAPAEEIGFPRQISGVICASG
jgi:hypothetical protein